MIDTQAIRSKILDLAMRGQLTEQLPEDGTAEELYQQIQKEKQALIKAGKIKKEKPLPRITAEEILYDIPDSWKWVNLGELFQHNTGKALNASDTQGQLLEYITTSNLYWDRFVLDNLKKMPFTEAEIEKCTVHKGDLLVCEGGDIGRSAIWSYDFDMRIQNHIHRLRRYNDSICTEFYYFLLWLYKQTGRINGIGIGLQGFSSKRVHSLVVPLVPYKEAERIVEKIKDTFIILDTIDKLQKQYVDNKAILKSKLIDAAIQGKLTEQLPDDGTAEELYQQIQEEKQALIKAGKLKKEKPLPEIAEQEIPFAIPRNWKWVRVGTIAEISGGTTPKSTEVSATGTIPYFKVSDMNVCGNETHMIHANNFIAEGYTGKIFPEGTTIFPKNGGAALTNKRRILVKPSAIDLNTGGCSPIISPMSDWIRLFMDTVDFGKMDTGSNIPTVNATNLKKQLLPLPPLAEQKRIVTKLKEILKHIEI